jgi:K+-transporting ATPase ATPase A chain
MTPQSLLLIAIFLAAALVCVKPLGLYIANVMEGKPVWALRVGAGIESLIYRLGGVDPVAEMGWKQYAIALLVFNALGGLLVYVLQRLQVWLPLNPQQFANVSPDSSFNTAVSFVTNTNWQGYSGESTMSYLTQMAESAIGCARNQRGIRRQKAGLRHDLEDYLRPAATERFVAVLLPNWRTQWPPLLLAS